MAAGGAGPLGAYGQETRRFQQSAEARRARSRALHAARLTAGTSAGPSLKREAENRAAHPCHHLCLECGALEPEPRESCSRCGEAALADLTLDTTAAEAEELAVRRAAAVPRWVKALLVAPLAAVPAIATAMGVWRLASFREPKDPVVDTLVNVVLGLLPVALLVASYLVLVGPLGRLVGRHGRRPERWRGPQRPSSPARRRVRRGRGDLGHGAALARGGLLTAPFSGAPCVAYEVAIAQRTASGRRWLLAETVSVDVEIGSVGVAAGRALLGLPLEPVEAEASPRLARFLRERGIAAPLEELELREAFLPEGSPAEVAAAGAGLFLLTPAPSPYALQGKGPYR